MVIVVDPAAMIEPSPLIVQVPAAVGVHMSVPLPVELSIVWAVKAAGPESRPTVTVLPAARGAAIVIACGTPTIPFGVARRLVATDARATSDVPTLNPAKGASASTVLMIE